MLKWHLFQLWVCKLLLLHNVPDTDLIFIIHELFYYYYYLIATLQNILIHFFFQIKIFIIKFQFTFTTDSEMNFMIWDLLYDEEEGIKLFENFKVIHKLSFI